MPEKRLDALLRAVASARRQRPDLRLEVYGDGPEQPRLEALVRELGLEEAVSVLGPRPEGEVASALARAACLATAEPDCLGSALLRVLAAGPALRASTAAWLDAQAEGLRIAASVDAVLRSYAEPPHSARSPRMSPEESRETAPAGAPGGRRLPGCRPGRTGPSARRRVS